MFCCALGAAILAAVALWRRRLRALFALRLTYRSALAGLFVIGLALAVSVLAIDHFDHAAAFAAASFTDGEATCQASGFEE